ncbi:HAMP domain-containing histidine kinase [bacterium]|nr:HAMP domain-containing histidine kinase [bacterium]
MKFQRIFFIFTTILIIAITLQGLQLFRHADRNFNNRIHNVFESAKKTVQISIQSEEIITDMYFLNLLEKSILVDKKNISKLEDLFDRFYVTDLDGNIINTSVQNCPIKTISLNKKEQGNEFFQGLITDPADHLKYYRFVVFKDNLIFILQSSLKNYTFLKNIFSTNAILQDAFESKGRITAVFSILFNKLKTDRLYSNLSNSNIVFSQNILNKGEYTGILKLSFTLKNILKSKKLIFYMNAISILGLYIFFLIAATFMKKAHELQLYSELLESRSHLLSGFAHSVSHELKNPLNNIYMAVQQMEASDTDKMLVNIISEETLKLNNKISVYLQFSESGQIKPTDFLISTLLKEFQGITFEINPRDTNIKTDRFLIKSILENLIINAKKAVGNNTGEKIINVKVTIKGNIVEFIVHNNGPRFTKKELQEMGTPGFSQFKSGTGYGIFIINTILEKLNSKLTFKNNQERGIDFTFSINQDIS